MTKIAVGADPSSVLGALDQIRQALVRTGQAGKDFSKIDFGHPELKQFEAQMRTLHNFVSSYSRIAPNSNLAQGLRQSGQVGRNAWDIDWDQTFPNQSQRQQFFNRLLRQMNNGGPGYGSGTGGGTPGGSGSSGGAGSGGASSGSAGGTGTGGASGGGAGAGSSGSAGGGASNPNPDPNQGGKPDPGGDEKLLDGFLSGSKITKVLKRFGAVAAVLGVGSMLVRGYRDAVDVNKSTDTAMRWSAGAKDFDELRSKIREVGKEFGVTSVEAARLSLAYSNASGKVEGSPEKADQAVAFAAGFGLDNTRTVRTMGGMELTGAFGLKGGMTQKEFALMLGETIARGGMGARGEEVMNTLARSVDRMSELTLASPDVSSMLALQMGMYKTGEENNLPGLRGQAGESLLQRIINGVTNPQDESSKFALARALNSAGVTDPFAQDYLKSMGAFGKVGDVMENGDNRNVIDVVMEQWEKDKNVVPNKWAADLIGGERLGIGGAQFTAWRQVWEKAKKFGPPTKLWDMLKDNGISPGSVREDGIAEIGKFYEAKEGGHDTLRAFMEQQIKGRHLSLDEGNKYRKMGDDELSSSLLQMIATQGRTTTDATDLQKAQADLQRNIEEMSKAFPAAVATAEQALANLIEPSDELKKEITELAEGIRNFAADLKKGREEGKSNPLKSLWSWMREPTEEENKKIIEYGEKQKKSLEETRKWLTDFALSIVWSKAGASELPFDGFGYDPLSQNGLGLGIDLNQGFATSQDISRLMLSMEPALGASGATGMMAPTTAPQPASGSTSGSSGSLPTKAEPPTTGAAGSSPSKPGAYPYQHEIEQIATDKKIPILALAGIIAQESSFDPKKVGDNGNSWGLGQLNKNGAAAELGLTKDQVLSMSAKDQINLTAEYLRRKIKEEGGNVWGGIERYNGGGDPKYNKHVSERVEEINNGKWSQTEIAAPGQAPEPAESKPLARDGSLRFTHRDQSGIDPDLRRALIASGRDLQITSGYRSPAHNAAVGGARESMHVQGKAADISMAGMAAQARADLVRDLHRQGVTRFGTYSKNPDMLHVDMGRAQGSLYAMHDRSGRNMDRAPEWFKQAYQDMQREGSGGANGSGDQIAATETQSGKDRSNVDFSALEQKQNTQQQFPPVVVSNAPPRPGAGQHEDVINPLKGLIGESRRMSGATHSPFQDLISGIRRPITVLNDLLAGQWPQGERTAMNLPSPWMMDEKPREVGSTIAPPWMDTKPYEGGSPYPSPWMMDEKPRPYGSIPSPPPWWEEESRQQRAPAEPAPDLNAARQSALDRANNAQPAGSAPITLNVSAWRDDLGRLQVQAAREDGNQVHVAQAAGQWQTKRSGFL